MSIRCYELEPDALGREIFVFGPLGSRPHIEDSEDRSADIRKEELVPINVDIDEVGHVAVSRRVELGLTDTEG